MTEQDLKISREAFNRLLAGVKSLNLGDFLLLKAAYAQTIGFERLSERVKGLLADVGRASEGVK